MDRLVRDTGFPLGLDRRVLDLESIMKDGRDGSANRFRFGAVGQHVIAIYLASLSVASAVGEGAAVVALVHDWLAEPGH